MRRLLAYCLCIITALWGLGLWLVPPAANAKAWVHEIFYLTGTLTWGLMVLALLIALRPAWIERVTNTALDKLYVWHRRLGWSAITLALIHTHAKSLCAPVMAWLALPRPAKVPASVPADWIEQLWRLLRPVAKTSSDWLVWIMLAICLVALVRWISYGRWLKLHRLLAIGVIVLSLHAVRLMDPTDFWTPFGWCNLTLTAVGLWAAISILLRGPGSAKTQPAAVRAVHTDGRTTVLTLEIQHAVPMRPGQFIFVKTPESRRHPFSVTRIENNVIELAVRASGTFTSTVVPKLAVGTRVLVEGPWGRFTQPNDGRQTWIAAGIGIAPFMAWLRAARPQPQAEVRLFWLICDRREELLLTEVTQLAQSAGVELIVHESRTQGRANPNDFYTHAPQCVALCGSPSLAKTLIRHPIGRNCPMVHEVFGWR
ncbi:MAG: ferric reductase-like transmembrane domain-containing protein [Duodenibacillus sp.]